MLPKVTYTRKLVRFNWKTTRLVLVPALLLLAGAGCSGINASKSVSPATFLLPGLLKAEPPPAKPNRELPVDDTSTEVAGL